MWGGRRSVACLLHGGWRRALRACKSAAGAPLPGGSPCRQYQEAAQLCGGERCGPACPALCSAVLCLLPSALRAEKEHKHKEHKEKGGGGDAKHKEHKEKGGGDAKHKGGGTGDKLLDRKVQGQGRWRSSPPSCPAPLALAESLFCLKNAVTPILWLLHKQRVTILVGCINPQRHGRGAVGEGPGAARAEAMR